ncbi:MAG TPA: ATP-NAD kinase family protein [Candidatus Lokiarchaeia archaeon]|nr:ATP-NAD kinase family protein [Candidatus Lokiarchaeia archaeon]
MASDASSRFRVGFIVNPIAGMGGSVGLKGTDGQEILARARELGATPSAGERAREFLRFLEAVRSKVHFLTVAGEMGEIFLQEADLEFEITYTPKEAETTPQDTIASAKLMKAAGVPLVVFVGGDGTARDIYTALGPEGIVIGVPAGVKIHSGVFATNPESAARVLLRYLWEEIGVVEAEVMDIDEDAFRAGSVQSQLYGYMLAPSEPAVMQWSKAASPDTVDEHENQLELGQQVVDDMRPGVLYLVGPGTTCRAVAEVLHIDKTLLGVDALVDKQWVAMDVNAAQILDLLDQYPESEIIVTAIGAQGFIFGRGNLQFSPEVLRRVPPQKWRIIMTQYKFLTLPGGHLRVDTRDSALDQELHGMYRVLVGAGEYRIVELS